MSESVPERWHKTQLGNCIGVQGGNAFKSEDFSENGVPIIRISNIKKDGSVNLEGAVYADEDEVLTKFKVENGDILIAMSGATTGKIGRYRSNRFSYLNQRVGKFSTKGSAANLDFIHHVTSMDEFIQSILIDAIGGAQPNISNKQIESIVIQLPPLPEQQKIAAILTSVDNVIESTQAQIDKLKDLKTGMMQELLTKGIGHSEFKDSPVGRIPVGWECLTVGLSCKIKNTLRKPISKEERELMKGIYPYFGPTKAVDYINEYRVTGEHVLIGEDGDHFTKSSTWSMTQYVTGQFNVNNHAHIIQGTTACRTKWFFYYFMHRDITSFLTRQGATRYKLNKAALEELLLALPPVQEQDRIIVILDALLADIDAKQAKVVALQSTKKALMQDLLTGKVRVKVD